MQPLGGILRAAARMIGGVPKFGHISEFMRYILRWLPVRQRIHYRLSTIVWRCVLGIAPTNLLGLFILTSSCTGRHLLTLPPEVILWCLMLAQPLNNFFDCGSLCLE